MKCQNPSSLPKTKCNTKPRFFSCLILQDRVIKNYQISINSPRETLGKLEEIIRVVNRSLELL